MAEARDVMEKKWDIIIIGGGPGGYVASLRAAQLKRRVALIENDRLGGTCINYGCIPTKYLLYHTHLFTEVKGSKVFDGLLEGLKINLTRLQKEKQRVVNQLVQSLELLLKRNGVEVFPGMARFIDERRVTVEIGGEERVLEGENLILATGSKPAELPFLKPNGEEVITSQEALECESVPKKLLVVGAGVVGIELGLLFQRLGSEVTILEIMPTLLPGWDRELVSRLQRILKVQGLTVDTQMRIEESIVDRGQVTLKGTCLKDNASFELSGEKVLLATGRKANSDEIASSLLGIGLDKSGFVRVNAHLETSIPGIYAIGDLTGGKLLAHKASYEGVVAVENISGEKKTVDYSALPAAVFSEPECASIGLTEEEAQERGGAVKVGRFPLRASGRALTMGREEGMVKIIANERDEILGAHILAPNASEIMAEMSLAMAKGLKLQDIASTIHIHPTLSEAVMEASLKANNLALHILNL